ncbi:hypothetical protein FRC0191_01872 [Corynebacterium diphtheriae]|uniref:hypothetical protein n=1 Tax=Corynebacterium diphtheriae TaxID=1717 RepID=UPI0013C5ABF4|nr:hypothetical protein [Corynebacterium diphtheriae]MBG9306400.1 hypothetical protein [Corynebacterium diphtheriae bv. mitis]CAB0812012.1 hypothetical protein FRC0191_01872 [Corynebacterium diphtheriae]
MNNTTTTCHACGLGTVTPCDWADEDDYYDDPFYCPACDYNPEEGYDPEDNEDDVADTVGTISENHIGVAILTPHGWWQLTDEEMLKLNAVLSSAICSRLTRPWSYTDLSTIVSRGRRVFPDCGEGGAHAC